MQNAQPYKVKVSISLDEDVIKEVRLLAEQDDRNFSQYINMVLKSHLKQQGDSDKTI